MKSNFQFDQKKFDSNFEKNQNWINFIFRLFPSFFVIVLIANLIFGAVVIGLLGFFIWFLFQVDWSAVADKLG